MLVVYIGAILTDGAVLAVLAGLNTKGWLAALAIALIRGYRAFANFAEAIAEGRGRAQASTLQGTQGRCRA